MKEFLLSDEKENCYGFAVSTSGINFTRFNKNPIMLFQHDRTQGTIGRWEKLRLEGSTLYGLPVFDDKHEPGKTVKEKVEAGFLRGASLGIEDLEFDTVNGVRTVVRCTLVEISIVDIPANENATVQLYYNDRPVENLSAYLQLSTTNKNSMNEQELAQVLNALGLSASSTVQDIIKAIETLKSTSPSEKEVKESLSLAYGEGIISESEKKFYECAFTGKPVELTMFLNERRTEKRVKQETEYNDFVSSHRENLGYFSAAFIQGPLKKLAMKDFESFKSVVEKIEPPLRPSQILQMGRKEQAVSQETAKPRCEWNLLDYRKNAPQELRDNPALYEELLNKEYNKLNH